MPGFGVQGLGCRTKSSLLLVLQKEPPQRTLNRQDLEISQASQSGAHVLLKPETLPRHSNASSKQSPKL